MPTTPDNRRLVVLGVGGFALGATMLVVDMLTEGVHLHQLFGAVPIAVAGLAVTVIGLVRLRR